MNSIVIYYSVINAEIEISQASPKLYPGITGKIWKNILSYTDNHERQLRLTGKLLLLQMLQYFNLPNLNLNDLQYSKENKPFFPDTDFSFSIAHSGNISICAGAINANIGVDIELIKPIKLEYLKDYLNEDELKIIADSDIINLLFYKTWTKKEAVLKASGLSSSERLLQNIDTTKEPIYFNNKKYFTHYLNLEEKYAGCVAFDKNLDSTISIKQLIVLT